MTPRILRRSRQGALALFLCLMCASAHLYAAELATDIQQRIRSAAFEVVQLKPPEGNVVYERALPTELMPYQERTDKYRSIGTAFALGPNRFATASHVIVAGQTSQFGPPALRDASGKVYDIDQVLQYSQREDFVVFSLRNPPAGVQGLATGPKPGLNDPVFSVGNALGEGVVIRDGVYTSDTPEQQDGEWQWLRFTAAASPGNSGGPLVDRNGLVIGLVLSKSPAENLNEALPIARLLEAKAGEGRIANRTAVRVPMLDASASEVLSIDERFPLPKSLADFYKTRKSLNEGAYERAVAQLLQHNAARLFPHGSGSEELLHQVRYQVFPQLLHEGANGIWGLGTPKTQTVQLEKNGFIEQTPDGLFHLRAPDDISASSLSGDSQLMMDLLLKGAPVRRPVGSESVRITSLGKATQESRHTDTYGRVWQFRSWPIPYMEAIMQTYTLSTPDGVAGLSARVPPDSANEVEQLLTMLLDYTLVTMEGTLAQWQDYLARKNERPKALDAIKIDIDPQKHVLVHSPRYELEVNPQLLKVSKDSLLRLNFSYFHDGDRVVWDVGGVGVLASRQSHKLVSIFRVSKPPSSLPAGFQDTWRKLTEHEFPFNATIEPSNGATQIATSTAIPAGADATKILYALRVTEDGTPPQADMSQKLELLQSSFKMLEVWR
jgi:hypothetical protein